MSQREATEAVVRALSVELEVPTAEILAATSLRGDVGLDSMSIANVVFSLEEEFDCELDLEGTKRLDTVDDIARLLGAALGEASS